MPLMDTAAQPRAAHCGVGAGVGLGVGGGVGTGIGAGDGALVGDPVIGCTHSVGMGVGGAVLGAGVVALHAATMGAPRPADWSGSTHTFPSCALAAADGCMDATSQYGAPDMLGPSTHCRSCGI